MCKNMLLSAFKATYQTCGFIDCGRYYGYQKTWIRVLWKWTDQRKKNSLEYEELISEFEEQSGIKHENLENTAEKRNKDTPSGNRGRWGRLTYLIHCSERGGRSPPERGCFSEKRAMSLLFLVRALIHGWLLSLDSRRGRHSPDPLQLGESTEAVLVSAGGAITVFVAGGLHARSSPGSLSPTALGKHRPVQRGKTTARCFSSLTHRLGDGYPGSSLDPWRTLAK